MGREEGKGEQKQHLEKVKKELLGGVSNGASGAHSVPLNRITKAYKM